MNGSPHQTPARPSLARARAALLRAAPRAQLLASVLIVVASAIPVARFLSTSLARISYPFDLEWCEGGTLGHIRMILAGHQPYQRPSFEFTPFLYTPLYYYVSALPALLLGAGHFAPRLVSLLSILGCFILLGRWVRNETGDSVAGVAAIGLLSAIYPLTGFWFELARVDAFFLLVVFSGYTLARTATTTRRAALVGAFIAAGCFTKQLGIPLAVPALLMLSVRSVRLGVVAALVAGALIVVAGAVFNHLSGGWFLYYVLDLPSRHEIQWERFWPSLQTFFLGSTFPMTAAGAIVVCGVGFRPGAWRAWLCVAAFVGLACASSFLPFLKSGGYPNGLIPAYASLALASGFALAALRGARGASALGALGPTLAALGVLAIQLVALDADMKPALPTAADLAANREVMARLGRLEKPIFITGSSFYGMTVTGQVVSDTMGLTDIFKGKGRQAERLDGEITEAIRSHRFKTIVLDRAAGFLPPRFTDLIRAEYVYKGSVLDGLPPDVIWPRSGASVRPDQIWVAK
jgi:hypothetical protein